MILDSYRITSEPYYQPVADEIAVFEAAFAERLPLMLKGADRLPGKPALSSTWPGVWASRWSPSPRMRT